MTYLMGCLDKATAVGFIVKGIDGMSMGMGIDVIPLFLSSF